MTMRFNVKTPALLLALIAAASALTIPATSAFASTGGASAPTSSTPTKPRVRPSGIATWFGPGFYGKQTACGERLTKELVGVAHRGLPCGREVKLYYKGRTITAPVVDRGPFRDHATWDLTAAAAAQLCFTRTDTIGAVSLPPAALAAP